MGGLELLLPLFLVFGVFIFMSSRRQKKAMQATIDLHESLTIGDRIHTTSGLEGTIAGVGEDTIELEIAPGVITTWMKLAVRDKIEDADEVDEEYEDDDEADDAIDAVEYERDVADDAYDVQPGTDKSRSPKTDS